jgi:hypothetical protein
MPVPRKKPCPAMRGPIALGKITNWEGKNPQGGSPAEQSASRWRLAGWVAHFDGCPYLDR